MSDGMIEELLALDASQARPLQKQCRVALVLQDLSDDQKDALAPLLEPGCPVASGKVAAVLRKWGYDISYHSVMRHRRRNTARSGCRCP
jgi:hypothetical protein